MNVRSYFVPRRVAETVPDRILEPLSDLAVRAAGSGQVAGYHLPLLASSGWKTGAEWATAVLEREGSAKDRRAEALLADAGYEPDRNYYGVLDSSYPDHELIVSVARDGNAGLEKWDGFDWGQAEVNPDGLEFVLLDEDVLVDVLDATDTGSAGVLLRPFEPKAWVRDPQVMDYPVLTAAGAPKHTGVMVALYPSFEVADAIRVKGGEPIEEIHLTLAYLGDVEEEPIDYYALQRAVAKWARRMTPIEGEIAGSGLFTAGEKPVTYASVDCPALPTAREMLVKTLEGEGVTVKRDHGYTPHMTLAWDDVDVDPPNLPLYFDRVTVKYGDDAQVYELGEPVLASAASPDLIYAVVDEFDTAAVLELIRVIPGPIAYRRSAGKWVKDQGLLMRLMGVDPPPVVEVSPDQTDAVLAQVDSYDKDHPEKPVTAAASWDESKYKREGGKFSKKNGSDAQPRPRKDLADKDVGLGPAGGRGGPGGRPTTRAGRAAGRGGDRERGNGFGSGNNPHGEEVRRHPWKALDEEGKLNAHLRPEFWQKQPPGFRDWLEGFLGRAKEGFPENEKKDKKKESDDGKGVDGKQSGVANDGKRDVAKGEQRSQKQVEAQKKAAAAGGHKTGAANLAQMRRRVPPRYRKAFDAFVNHAAASADRALARDKRRKDLAAKDRKFNLGFAKEGLGEARRRELFDRQAHGQASRLVKSGVDPRAVRRVMEKKYDDERRARTEFERRRKLVAEQESIRRLAARNAEADEDGEEALTAATRMPSKLKSYWAKGEGAAKIRWGTGGDYGRCTRALAKYLPAHMVKGACANIHHLATGKWPGKGRSH